MKLLVDVGFILFGMTIPISLLLAATKSTAAKLKIPAVMQLLAAILVLAGAVHVFITDGQYTWGFDYLNMFAGVRFVMDRLAAFFVMLLMLVVIPVSLYSTGYMKEYTRKYSLTYFNFFTSLFIATMLTVVLSQNLFFFLVAWELMSVSSYFLVVYEHGKRPAVDAGSLYIIMTHLGALFLIVGFALLSYYGQSFDLEIIKTGVQHIPHWVQNLIFVSLLIAFGSKAGLIPLHIWLPEAHPAAPSNVSALMSGVMLKVAVYGFVRLVFNVLGFGAAWWGVLVALIGAVTALIGIIYAVTQRDIKRFLAFSSAENMGIIFATLGVAGILSYTGQAALSSLALAAALFHCINHAIYKSLLFLGAGNIIYATGKRNLDEMGGLGKKLPRTAVLFFMGTAAIAAMPPLNGFMSEWAILLSVIKGVNVVGQPGFEITLLLVGMLLALTAGSAIYGFVTLYGIIFSGTPRTDYLEHLHPLEPVMERAMTILAGLTVVLALGANWFLANLGSQFTFGNMPALMGVFLVIIGLIYAGTKMLNPKERVEVGETWACGFNNLDGKLQYTAKGFVQPFRRNYQLILRSEKKKQFDKHAFKKEKLTIEVSIVDLFEEGIYKPILKLTDYLSRLISKIHLGHTQVYILYILLALVVVIIKVLAYV